MLGEGAPGRIEQNKSFVFAFYFIVDSTFFFIIPFAFFSFARIFDLKLICVRAGYKKVENPNYRLCPVVRISH